MVKGSERIMSFSTSGISYLQHLRWMVISSILKTIESPLKCFFCGTIMIFHMCLLWMPQVPFLGGCYSEVYTLHCFQECLQEHYTPDNALLTVCLPCLFHFPLPFQWVFYSSLFLNHSRPSSFRDHCSKPVTCFWKQSNVNNYAVFWQWK